MDVRDSSEQCKPIKSTDGKVATSSDGLMLPPTQTVRTPFALGGDRHPSMRSMSVITPPAQRSPHSLRLSPSVAEAALPRRWFSAGWDHSPLSTDVVLPPPAVQTSKSTSSRTSTCLGQEKPNVLHFDPAFKHSHTFLGDWRATAMDEVPAQFDGSLASILAHSECDSDRSPSEIGDEEDREPGEDEEQPCEKNSRSIEVDVNNALPELPQLGPKAWLLTRIGPWPKVALILCFMKLSGAKFVMEERAYVPRVNFFSMNVITHLVSLLTSLTFTFLFEGSGAWPKIFSWHPFWRFSGISFLFTLADVLVMSSRWAGSSSSQVVTIGYIYLPVACGLSYFVFNRKYGKLEWLTCGMMTLGILTFVLLREQSREQEERQSIDFSDGSSSPYNIPGLLLAVSAVFASVVASILAERIFKHRSRGLRWWTARFCTMKVHIDVTGLAMSSTMWIVNHVLQGVSAREGAKGLMSDMLSEWQSCTEWFGHWTHNQVILVLLGVAQGWTAGLMVKEFSTVTRAIFQTLCFVFVMLFEDPLMGGRWNFRGREVPSIVLTLIIVLAAIIFQTGRLNLKVIQQAANLVISRREEQLHREPHPSDISIQIREPHLEPATATSPAARSGHITMSQDERGQTDQEPKQPKSWYVSLLEQLWFYALMIFYIVFDAIRNLTLAKALNSVQINPNSLNLVSYSMGIFIASCLTLYMDGCKVLWGSWRVKKIVKFFPAGCMFALSTTLMNMAYSQGMNAALALVLGKFYTPVAVMGARCANPKLVYMWIEYVALAILTLATVAFGYLQVFPTDGGKAPSTSSMYSMFLVIGSASCAALNSLLMERILKGETDGFRIQKVRIDCTSILATGVLIPLLGVISSYPLNVPWQVRPISSMCPKDSVCFQQDGCSNPLCDCECDSGLFAGWTKEATIVLMIALVINTGYGWIVGRVVQEFSTVHRAVADAFSLLLVYFVGDPLINGASLGNMCLNMVAFIVPLSAAIFAVAASEMKKVFEAAQQLAGDTNTADASDEVSEDEANAAETTIEDSNSEPDDDDGEGATSGRSLAAASSTECPKGLLPLSTKTE